MTRMKSCTICGRKVSIEKFESHLKNVHPKERIDIFLNKEEQKEIREAKTVYKPPKRARGKWAFLLITATIIIVIIAISSMRSGLRIGDSPPDIMLQDTDNQLWNLNAEIRNNRSILLEFMHPDCEACKNIASMLEQWYIAYSSNLTMISVVITLEAGQGFRNPPTVDMARTFKSEHNSSWRYVVETSGTHYRDQYSVTGTPAFFLIGKDGRIVYILNGDQGSYIGLENSIKINL